LSYTVDAHGVWFDGELLATGDKRRQLRPVLFAHAVDLVMWRKQMDSVCGEASFAGEVLLSVDPEVPWLTLREVLFTLGQARFSRVFFAVHAAESTPLVDLVVDPTSSQAVVLLPHNAEVVVQQANDEEIRVPLTRLASLEPRVGCAVVVPAETSRAGDVVQLMSTFHEAGVRRLSLAAGATTASGGPTEGAAVATTEGRADSRRLALNAQVEVLLHESPAAHSPPDPTDDWMGPCDPRPKPSPKYEEDEPEIVAEPKR
jgi:biopolymer transport protein ExbD